MNSTTLVGSSFSLVLQTSWQAVVLVLLVIIVQMIFRNKLSPSWRYGLWLLVVLRLLMPLPPPSAFSIFNLARTAPVASNGGDGRTFRQLDCTGGGRFPVNSLAYAFPTNSQFNADPSDGVPPPPRPTATRFRLKTDWFAVAFYGWLAGVCCFGARLLWSNVRFRSRIGAYQSVADVAVVRLFDDCRAALTITQPVRLIECEEVESPAVYGIWRKRLLLPDGVFERFSSAELRHIFLHELAHIKRRDIEVNWLTALLRIVHWFNPVLWLAFARMRADRELATDAFALAHVAGTENVPYGETILKVLENLTHPAVQPGLVGIAESKAGLKQRLRAISRIGAAKHWRWAAIGTAAIVAVVGLTGAQQTYEPNAAGKHETGAIPRDSAPHISGRVVDVGGHPVAGAQLAIFKPKSELFLTGEPRIFNPEFPHLMGEPRLENLPWNYCTTDAQGRFFLNDLAEALFLLVAQERGFARILTNKFSTNMTVTLEPWGRIEGTLWHYDEVVTNAPVSAHIAYYDRTAWRGSPGFNTKTDGHGRFSISFAPPDMFTVFGSGMHEMAVVKPGETAVVQIGGKGRPVIGKFKMRNPYVQIQWDRIGDAYYFSTEPPRPSQPFKTREDYSAWRTQPQVEHSLDNNYRGYSVQRAKDGSFRIDQVEPGNYEMAVSLRDPSNPTTWIARYDGYDGTFDIPAGKLNTREPLDLGVLELSLNPQIAVEKRLK